MNLDAPLQTFIIESRELLQAMEDSLLLVESEADQTESINAIFRAAHTIKGSSGLFGLDYIVGFTHVLESVLDKIRDGRLVITSDLVALFLSCGDHMATLIDHVENGTGEPGDQLTVNAKSLIERLSIYLGESKPSTVNKSTTTSLQESEASVEASGGGMVGNDYWHISLRFGHDVLRNGMDPLSFFRYLGTLGEIVAMTTLESVPAAGTMDPESCYMGYEIDFNTNADKVAIEGVFEFVREDCQIFILPPKSCIIDFVNMIKGLPEEDMRLGEILIKCGTLTGRELEEILESQRNSVNVETISEQKLAFGEIAVNQGLVMQSVLEAALDKQKQVQETKTKQQQLVRVDAEKLDHLINLIGELVIAGASANLIAQRNSQPDMLESASTISRLIEEVRDSTLNLRMVQIGETFNRFQRVVRDVSKDLGKEIQLLISGAETELDKMVVDKIGDPLTHLVRNSIDHGIESAELRAARGKTAKGKVQLNAYHESGSIVIEVSDDGGGLNREKILAKAVEKGIVAVNQTLSDQEVYRLIFEAGFSTAEQVSNISGRGVGMDVVRRNIEALRGSIEIDSRHEQGTTFRIRLPLTLAIIDGFLVGVGKSSLVIPLDMVVECIDMTEEDRSAADERSYINLRGEVLPFLRMRELFEIEAAKVRRENIVVVQYGTMRAGLVVDSLHGEFQTVIKPLGKLFARMRGIGGSTILGTGEVALILDVPSLVQQAVSNSQKDVVKVAARSLQ